MTKSKVYTKTGDKGQTSLLSGERVNKSENRIDLYGDVDELNSEMGYLFSLMKSEELDKQHDDLFINIQSSLFDLGALLACSHTNWEKYKLKKIPGDLITQIELSIDLMDSHLPKLQNFILPGGTKSAAYSHVVRTSCRRVERKLVQFGEASIVPENSVELLNRLSDYLFVLGRFINNKSGVVERIWIS